MIELNAYEKQWILLTKGSLQKKYPFTGKWVNTLKPLFEKIYGWDPDIDYQQYLRTMFDKLLDIYIKIREPRRPLINDLLDIFSASFFMSCIRDEEHPIERSIAELCAKIQNTSVLNSDGSKRFIL